MPPTPVDGHGREVVVRGDQQPDAGVPRYVEPHETQPRRLRGEQADAVVLQGDVLDQRAGARLDVDAGRAVAEAEATHVDAGRPDAEDRRAWRSYLEGLGDDLGALGAGAVEHHVGRVDGR